MPVNTDDSKAEVTFRTRKSVNEALKARDLPNLDEEEDLEEQEATEIAAGAQVDVFDYCHDLVEKGDTVGYTIKKNSSFLARKPHPYSWEKIQKEFGEGHYQIIAKSELTKRILKQQTSFVTAAPEVERKESVADAVRAALPREKDSFEEMTKMATLLRSLQPEPKTDNSGTVMLEFMKTMMQMSQTAQQSTMTMIEKMQENTNRLLEKMDASQKAAMDKIEARLTSSPDKKGMDPMTLVGLLQKAEEKGRENYMLLDELAEKKAARLAGTSKDEDEEPKSMLEKLVAAGLPAITKAMAQPQPPAQPYPTIRPRPRAVVPPPAQPRPAQPVAAQPAQPQPVQPQPKTPVVVPKATKDQALEKLIPLTLTKLMEADGVKEDAKAVVALQKQAALDAKVEMGKLGITIPGLLQMVSEGDMLDIATEAGLPQEAHKWLKGFYAHLKELAPAPAVHKPVPTTRDVGAEPRSVRENGPVQATGQQPNNT